MNHIADEEGPQTVDGPALSSNARTVLEERYLARDDRGLVAETPAELFRRVARFMAAVEEQWQTSPKKRKQLEDQFYQLMTSRRFFPNSPTLMNAGRSLGSLSACFVLDLEDSIPEIMETARQIALVQRAGGGTGIDLSGLRPKGSIVKSSGGTTDGPLSFLKMFSGVTDAIQQGAFRRGANMGVMRIDHPDIMAFISLKSDLTQVTNYNLSVGVTEDFMESLQANPQSVHVVLNPHTSQRGYLDRETGQAVYDIEPNASNDKCMTVAEIWGMLAQHAWQSGEPGLFFVDETNRHNPTPHLGTIRATNPCGEQPLLPYEACNLGSINLAAFYDETVHEANGYAINWDSLRETVPLAVRFLDNVIESGKYPTEEISEATYRTRKIGLGVMGFADLLFLLGIPYDSEDAVNLAARIGQFIQDAAWSASEQLALVRGKFPAWEGSCWDTQHGGRAMRNSQVTTIAPTGTISIIADCSSGIEPVFSLAFERQVLGDKTLLEFNPVFVKRLKAQVQDEEKVSEILQYAALHGSIRDCEQLPSEFRNVFRTARDIDVEWHVRMQAAWQQHTDAAVSKTVNLPAEASVEDVERAFQLAYELKCKGITVYRDGSRPLQPMTLLSDGSTQPVASKPVVPIRLPEIIPSVRLRQPTPFGNMHLHISVEPQTGQEREVFAQLGKGGDLANSDLEAICRLVSLLLRSGGDLRLVIDQLEDIGSSLSVPAQGGRVRSLGDGLARALQKYLAAKEHHGLEDLLSGRVKCLDSTDASAPKFPGTDQESLFKIKCPDCNAAGTLAFEEGCLKCHVCGYSIC